MRSLPAPLLVPLLLAALLAAPACKSAQDAPAVRAGGDTSAAPAGGTADGFSATGTIRYVDLEGGFYGIEAADGKRYNPLNLEERFRRDGLAVRFRARVRAVMTVQMWGTPVDIVEMTAVEGGR